MRHARRPFTGEDDEPLLDTGPPLEVGRSCHRCIRTNRAAAGRAGGPAVEQLLQRRIAAPAPEPGQAFDNLYFVGSGWVSAWVLKTSDGLILIDALNNALEARGLIEGGMRKLGLDPAQIKYIVVTHGHGDHYGGAPMLVEQYRTRVVGGRTHRAMIWGGTSFNFGRDMGRLDSYIAQTERMRQVAARRSVDVMLSNHPGYDGVADRSMRILNECARAQKARFQIS